MSLEELKKELYGDIREFAAELVKCNERKNAFVKETRCDYESFMKRQKKERKRASQKQEQSKVRIKESKSVIQKNFTLPSDCAIHPNSVGMIHFSHIKMLASLIIYLNNEISKISRMVNAIKMWISLKIPRIEDGNNVGVSIQEECIGMLQDMETYATGIISSISTYFTDRGELLGKVGLRKKLYSRSFDSRKWMII